MDYTEYARLFKALSDPKRLKIVHMLAGGELCACKILEEFHITQPTLSHDMKLLTDTGLVIPRREGKWTHYSLNKARVGEICRAAEGLMVPETGTMVCGCGKEERKKEDMEKMETVNTKLYVLTGFLGSGKTTALLKLLERLKGSRIGVIQNEFGKLGIDGTILRNDDIQMVEINRGSIFCTCQKLNFVKALADMAQQDFDYLFVESSGWGDPSNVQEILDAARIVHGDSQIPGRSIDRIILIRITGTRFVHIREPRSSCPFHGTQGQLIPVVAHNPVFSESHMLIGIVIMPNLVTVIAKPSLIPPDDRIFPVFKYLSSILDLY